MLARRRPLTVKWIPNTATWNKSSAREQASEQKRWHNPRESRQLYHAQMLANMFALSGTASGYGSVYVCVCGCEGSAVIAAATSNNEQQQQQQRAAAAAAAAAAIAVTSFPFSQFRVVPRSALPAQLQFLSGCRRMLSSLGWNTRKHQTRQKVKKRNTWKII